MDLKKIAQNRTKILVVDDSPGTLEVIQRNLEAAAYEVSTASSVEQAIAFLEQSSVNLIITDIKMPKVSGLELLKYVKENVKGTEIMIITGYPSIKGAVNAVKDGAENYLAKPGTNGNYAIMHATGNYMGGSEVDGPLIYADYYFIEGLLRYTAIMNNKSIFK